MISLQEPTSVVRDPEFLAQWPEIRSAFLKCQKASTYVSLATVRPDGTPGVAPIGSFCLNEDPSGFYLEIFSSSVPRHQEERVRVSIMAVDSRPFFWFRSLWRGRFSHPPAIRLLGWAGPLREASEEEQQRFLKRVRPLRGTKGYKLLWSNVSRLREVHFDGWEPARLGKMTTGKH